MLRLKLLLLSICVSISSLYTDELIFRVMDLGTLQADSSEAFAINNNNQVIGKYTLEGENFFFLWANGEHELINLPSTSQPKAINSFCQICAQYTTDKGTRGFYYDKNIGVIDIGTLGGDNTWVEDMNESGQIVGYSETGNLSTIRPEQKEIHAFVWSKGIMRDLGVLKGDIGQGGDESKALGINDQGEIIGFSNYSLVNKGKKFVSANKACLWKNYALQEIFQAAHPAAFSHAFDINNKKEIIIGIQESVDYYALYYLNLKTGEKEILFQCNVPFAQLKKINNNAILIGSPSDFQAYFSDMNYKLRGTVYRNIPLVSDFSWKRMKKVLQINDHNIMCGIAENIYGEEHAVILLPE